MSISRGDLKNKILRILNKTSKYKGAYTSEKMDDAIEDCLDYISVEMAIANEGWNTDYGYFTTIAGQSEVTIPDNYMLINQVRYKVGDEYIPLTYDQDRGAAFAAGDSGYTQYPSRYSVVNNKFFFNPVLAEGGTDALQVQFTSYPEAIISDLTVIPTQFDNAMLHFMKFRAASYLASSVGKYTKEWAGFEKQWYEQIIRIISKRNNVQMHVREFEG